MKKEITGNDIVKGLDIVDTEEITGKATHIEIDPDTPEKMDVYGDFQDGEGKKYSRLYVEVGEYYTDDAYVRRYPTPEELEEYSAGELLQTGWTYYEALGA